MTSEKKMQIVIDNYFKSECNVDTSIRDAFEKGFRIGVQKTVNRKELAEVVRCKDCKHYNIPIGEDGWTVCPMNIAEQPNAFCSRGERREP